ncbi:MAG: hypothetical protein HDR20_11820 [Lachnospiraceae bacterium]|nr:hypothetical protein [Lachnospiraceae bacterium]
MKEKREWIHTIANASFYAAILIEVMIVIVDKSNYTNPIEGRLFQLTFVLCFVKVCLTRYTFREYGTIFLFGIIGAVSYFVTGRNELLRLIILIAACKDVDMRKCLKVIFWLTLAGCLGIILLSVSGIYGNISLTADFGRGGVETRYALGMGHPNALHCMVWALTALGLHLYGNELKWYHYLEFFVVNIGVFCLSFSRTSLLTGIFTIVLSFLVSGKRSEAIKKAGAWIGGLAAAGSIVVSIVFAANAYRVYNYAWHLYGEEPDKITRLFVKLDRVLSGRIRILTETDSWEGAIGSWSLFSRPDADRYFDLGWVRLFYWYGVIPAGICIMILFVLILYCYRKKQYSAIALIAAFSVYTVIEAHGVSDYLARNYMIFLVGQYWCQMLSKESEHENSNG